METLLQAQGPGLLGRGIGGFMSPFNISVACFNCALNLKSSDEFPERYQVSRHVLEQKTFFFSSTGMKGTLQFLQGIL